MEGNYSKLAITSFILGIISLHPFIILFYSISSLTTYFTNKISNLAFIIPIIGIIIGIISIVKIKKYNLKGRAFAVMGILFSSMIILLAFLFVLLIALSWGAGF